MRTKPEWYRENITFSRYSIYSINSDHPFNSSCRTIRKNARDSTEASYIADNNTVKLVAIIHHRGIYRRDIFSGIITITPFESDAIPDTGLLINGILIRNIPSTLRLFFTNLAYSREYLMGSIECFSRANDNRSRARHIMVADP
jgi:hypothetical protein